MGDILVIDDRAAMAGFAADWPRLAGGEALHVPAFDDLTGLLADPAVDLRLVADRAGGDVRHLAVVVAGAGRRAFWLGPRRLMSLRVRFASLFGGTILGAPDEAAAARMLAAGLDGIPVDLVVLDDLPDASALARLAAAGRLGRLTRLSRRNARRRLIRLPADMAAYWNMLRPNVRRTTQRDIRYFERLAPVWRHFAGQDAVTDFLPAAARLSARTYQRTIGLGLVDDADTRARFARLAAAGRLRCHLAVVDGEAAAFAWGEIAHGVFYFRMTGYDPATGHASAGKAVLIETVRALIAEGAAHSFDFGIRDMPYKARFGPTAVPCTHVLAARSPRGAVAVTIERLLDAAKERLPRLIDADRLRRLKRRLRGQR